MLYNHSQKLYIMTVGLLVRAGRLQALGTIYQAVPADAARADEWVEPTEVAVGLAKNP